MAGSGLDTYLTSQKARVESLLSSRLTLLSGRVPPKLFLAMRYSLLDGGKRLRPILVLSFAEAVSKTSGGGGALAEDAACALEYVHTYSLIHDDLPAMDDDDLRRGRPTCHKAHGEAMAILAGDALLTEAFALLAGADHPNERAALCRELATSAGAAGMVAGQALDIDEDRPAEEGYLLRMHRLKTGALIRAACCMGVIAARGSAAELELAGVYGDAVGLAFQIADDLLDLTATRDELGKPVRADAAAGRHTFPAVLGEGPSRSRAAERVERAVRAVGALEPSGGPLAALARYAVERKK
ncbi:MAG: polyprenyl synthetase family protein [Myxococcaceae bacterium]